MRTVSAPFLLLGTFFTASGYGATFLISQWYKSLGGSDIDAGTTLTVALFGTFIGVPLVGWFAGRFTASRLTTLAALCVAGGYLLLASVNELNMLPKLATLLIGFGWGMFYIGAPMALSERITDNDRLLWFNRFSAFQMAGMCSSPIILTAVVKTTGILIQDTFFIVGLMGVLAAIMLASFHVLEPRNNDNTSIRPWVKKFIRLTRTPAIRPIIIAGLGGCIFSGIMSFQHTLVEGTGARASTFFGLHAATVVIFRLLLARRLSLIPRMPLITVLLSCLLLGVVSLLGVSIHLGFQIIAAILTGIGYGLVYPVIQTWAVNGSNLDNRHAALTWFVVAYFIGIFGFPLFGGWLIVEAGIIWFIAVLSVLSILQLTTAFIRLPFADKIL